MTLFKQAEKEEEEGRNIEDEVKMTTKVSVCHFLVQVSLSFKSWFSSDAGKQRDEQPLLWIGSSKILEFENHPFLLINLALAVKYKTPN